VGSIVTLSVTVWTLYLHEVLQCGLFSYMKFYGVDSLVI
jgi:hypothetical protein